jgi:hypothetical protein
MTTPASRNGVAFHTAAYGDPGSERRAGERQAEHQVGEGGEPLGVRIAEQDRERDRRERERQRVELPGGEHEQSAACEDEDGHEAGAHVSGGQRAAGGAGIVGVDAAIDEPVEAHRGAPRADHGDDDPADDPPAGPSARRQHHAEEGKGQSEQRVLDLDHFEHGPE